MFWRRKNSLKRRIDALEQRVTDLEFQLEIPHYNSFGYAGGIKLRDIIHLILRKLDVTLQWQHGTTGHFELEDIKREE